MQLVINTFGSILRKQGDRFLVRAGPISSRSAPRWPCAWRRRRSPTPWGRQLRSAVSSAPWPGF